MKRIIDLTCLINCIIALFISCNSVKQKQFSSSTYASLSAKCGHKNTSDVLIYYFDGDCSFCFSKIKFLSDAYKSQSNVELIFIAKTLNPLIFKHNFNKLNVRGCIYINNDHSFDKTVKINDILVVRPDLSYKEYEILDSKLQLKNK